MIIGLPIRDTLLACNKANLRGAPSQHWSHAKEKKLNSKLIMLFCFFFWIWLYGLVIPRLDSKWRTLIIIRFRTT